MSLLDVRNLGVHFPVRVGSLFRKQTRILKAVDGVSFQIEEGEALGLVGESGCGKSTTARAAIRLIEATEGEILFDGKNLRKVSDSQLRSLRKNFQMVFQNPYSSLNPRWTVEQIIREPLDSLTKLTSAEKRKRIEEVLDLVQLDTLFLKRYPHEFSGGQRQRINIARALAVKPKLLVLDEPVSALDVSIQAQIINLLQDLQTQLKLSYLFIAHDIGVVKALCHRVAVMYLGRIVEIGTSQDILETPKHPYTQALLSAVPIPNPDEQIRRIPLKSEVPSPLALPSGCAFHPRCLIAEAVCRESRPELRPVRNQSAACHFAE